MEPVDELAARRGKRVKTDESQERETSCPVCNGTGAVVTLDTEPADFEDIAFVIGVEQGCVTFNDTSDGDPDPLYRLTPDEARDLAQMILVAADQVEEQS